MVRDTAKKTFAARTLKKIEEIKMKTITQSAKQ